MIGRGALEATGIGFELTADDVAIRGNFCTLDAAGKISDRRAGRIAQRRKRAAGRASCAQVKIPGVEVFVEPVKEHRFVVVFRGAGLGGDVHDTDPQATGVPPLAPKAANAASERTAEVAAEFVAQGQKILADQKQANGLTLRGFSARAAAAELTKKSTASRPPRSPSIRCTRAWPGWSAWTSSARPKRSTSRSTCSSENWTKYDFFFIHFKYTDSTGEDGNFDAKVKRIEELDADHAAHHGARTRRC